MILYLGDAKEKLKRILPNSVDAVVTDPPYGLSFMNKKWDYDVPTTELWSEVFRVLKPGGHLLAFFGTRTYHRGVVRIEDAGFEIRDQIQWIYGSGFPKSLDVSKAIDKAAGAEREIVTSRKVAIDKWTEEGRKRLENGEAGMYELPITAPATPEAKRWQGWGTALKPANEPIVLARKPLEKGLTVAENVLKWGTGAINVDGCRVGDFENKTPSGLQRFREWSDSHTGQSRPEKPSTINQAQGRWPANVIFNEAAAAMLDEQSGPIKTKLPFKKLSEHTFGVGDNEVHKGQRFESQKGLGITIPGASRFFYVAKASKRERNAGLEGMPEKAPSDGRASGLSSGMPEKAMAKQSNFHPTVKPIKLMEYLIKLVTPPSGVVLDPFMGSGSTGVAAKNLGFNFIGIELNEEYFEIAKRRIEHAEGKCLEVSNG